MNFLKNLKKNDSDANYSEDYYGKNDNDTGDVYEEPIEEAPAKEPERPAAPARRTYAPAETAAYSMKLMKPVSYDDGPMIADALLQNNAVIINLENASAETAANLIFFLDGVTYAINGHLKPVSANTFMLTPKNMEISEAAPEAPAEAPAEEAPQGFSGGYGGFGGGYGYRN